MPTFSYVRSYECVDLLTVLPCIYILVLCSVKATEALVDVFDDMLWMDNYSPEFGGAIYLTSHAQVRLHPSANLTFVANKGKYVCTLQHIKSMKEFQSLAVEKC